MYNEINIHHARKGITKSLNTFFDKSQEMQFLRSSPDFQQRKKDIINNILYSDEHRYLLELKSHINLLKYKISKHETSQH